MRHSCQPAFSPSSQSEITKDRLGCVSQLACSSLAWVVWLVMWTIHSLSRRQAYFGHRSSVSLFLLLFCASSSSKTRRQCLTPESPAVYCKDSTRKDPQRADSRDSLSGSSNMLTADLFSKALSEADVESSQGTTTVLLHRNPRLEDIDDVISQVRTDKRRVRTRTLSLDHIYSPCMPTYCHKSVCNFASRVGSCRGDRVHLCGTFLLYLFRPYTATSSFDLCLNESIGYVFAREKVFFGGTLSDHRNTSLDRNAQAGRSTSDSVTNAHPEFPPSLRKAPSSCASP